MGINKKKKADVIWNRFVDFRDRRFNNHHYKASYLLGQNILHHDLVIGDTKTENAIICARNLKEILEILHSRRMMIYNKSLSLPGNRDLYIKYLWENAEKLIYE